ncbi:FAD/NAD(P)-binding protein [Bradyrhizobium sp. HKCCYLS1011]|uniref:FAD/NAD(P)-binding protein n=1 Tax=Bradyrhizobium sp. HKCCYLS1011 TaxID=3420733 RepID=UPI003EB8850A
MPLLTAAAQIDPFVPQLYKVAHVRRELSDVVTLEIKPSQGSRPSYAPGQFNMLYAFGIGEIAISISGDCTDSTGFVHTVRDVGAVSRAIAALDIGATLGVRGPFGTAWPVTSAEGSDILIIAGGLGLAPLRPAITHVLANRARYGRVAILFGCRHPEDILFHDQLAAWRGRLDIAVEVTVDHADSNWRGHVGAVPALIPRVSFSPHDTVALVCGPEIMMRFTANALRDAGVASNQIYLSMERNMKCAIGLCGHCQFGPTFVCKDGPVMRFDRIERLLTLREI